MSLQHRKNTAGNNASTIKWVFNTGEYSREQCINHQMGLQQENTAGETIKWVFNTGEYRGTMHQPSNGSSTQEEYSREQCINHQMSLQHRRIQQEQCINHQMGLQHRENTAGNNASTIKWVFNTGEYSKQCINHQMGLQHRKNTAVTMHQPSNESSTQEEYSREQCINHQMGLQHRRIQQEQCMQQPSNGSSTQGEYSREQCINHQMGLQNTAGSKPSNESYYRRIQQEQCINHQMSLQYRREYSRE
ncbi:unnamed protein product [Mytilus edulis]|uniref:Uncharacterized protein n=1 Tax=Mytilus edulis TaxID=6550 RepID=A0A8S3T5A7_MYTED|nr:unnamed protein product [Mytilus edulis]